MCYNARILCVDGCGGLVAGAILEKLAPAAVAAAAAATAADAADAADAAASGDAAAAAGDAAADGDVGAGCVRGGMGIAYPDERAAIDAGDV